MNINFMSDLHLEFSEIIPEQAEKNLPEGDVLALAGDIFVLKSLGKLKYFDKFLEIAKSKYKLVVAIAGNHEYYGVSLDNSVVIREFYANRGVKFLNDESVEFDGKKIFGGTLWPDMNKDDFATKVAVKACLNDYHVIGGLTPSEAVRLHRDTIRRLERDGPDVVVTHMAPHFRSIHPRYHSAGLSNYGYYSDVNIPECVKLWVHGHVHHKVDYTVGETRVVANPRGYPHEGISTGFQFDRTVQIHSGAESS